MIKIILEKENIHNINFSDLDANVAIFAKRDGGVRGMVVKEDRGWSLRVGGSLAAYGFDTTLLVCLTTGAEIGYSFYIEDAH